MVTMNLLLVCVLSVLLGSSTEAARILGIFHVPTWSHFTIGTTVLKGLADKGHDVTIAGPFPSKDKNINYREIHLDGVPELGEALTRDIFKTVNGSIVSIFKNFANFSTSIAELTLKNKGLQKLMKDGEKFDILLIDNFANDAFLGFAHIFNSHSIVLSTGYSDFVNQQVGNIAPPSFVPHLFTTLSDKMTFTQRLINTIVYLLTNFLVYLVSIPTQKQLYEDNFKDVPSFEDTYKNISLAFVNSHVVFETPRPYLPNMIQINGVHIQKPKKLPKDLQTFLDNSKQGVIYFSLGSNVYSKDLPQDTVDVILKSFAKFPQNVLWKFEDENLKKTLPKNVQISKWYPQRDILAHPNVKLFITHGGFLSSTEAVFRGVPIVGVPLYGDQPANIAKLVASGYGQQILLEDLNEESFTSVIKEVLDNKSYFENVQRSSAILLDYPQHPLDLAIFWVEHVIRTNGARHLRSASLDLTIPQLYLLDVLAFAGVVIGVFVAGIYLVVKILCCGRRKKGENKTKRE